MEHFFIYIFGFSIVNILGTFESLFLNLLRDCRQVSLLTLFEFNPLESGVALL